MKKHKLSPCFCIFLFLAVVGGYWKFFEKKCCTDHVVNYTLLWTQQVNLGYDVLVATNFANDNLNATEAALSLNTDFLGFAWEQCYGQRSGVVFAEELAAINVLNLRILTAINAGEDATPIINELYTQGNELAVHIALTNKHYDLDTVKALVHRYLRAGVATIEALASGDYTASLNALVRNVENAVDLARYLSSVTCKCSCNNYRRHDEL